MHDNDLMVERAAVIRMLARMALNAGVEIRGGCKLTHLEPGDRAVKFTIRDSHRDRIEEFSSRVLIGADDMSSRGAKIAGGNGHQTTPIL